MRNVEVARVSSDVAFTQKHPLEVGDIPRAKTTIRYNDDHTTAKYITNHKQKPYPEKKKQRNKKVHTARQPLPSWGGATSFFPTLPLANRGAGSKQESNSRSTQGGSGPAGGASPARPRGSGCSYQRRH
ncbi:hypothetical protein RJ035_001010 [Blastomyces gilchristii]